MHHQFGSGCLYGLVLSGGILVPRKFGALQDVSLDVSFTKKKLFGQSQFPLSIVRGQGSVIGKAKFANINGAMFNDMFFGQVLTGASAAPIYGESATIGSTPYQVTVTNSGTWTVDLGVIDTTSGIPMTRVASGPTTGQYSVAAGVYTFAAADTGHVVIIDYLYSVSASGSTITLTNPQAGTTPNFQIAFPIKSQASPGGVTKSLLFRLNLCVSDKLSMATKNEDFMIPELDFEAAADASGNIGSWATSE